MTVTIGESNVLDLLKQAMETKGPYFRYSDGRGFWGCFYTPIDEQWHAKYGHTLAQHLKISDLSKADTRRQTGCLIGVALKLAGIDDELLAKYSACGYVHRLVELLTNEGALNISAGAIAVFKEAQLLQDGGQTWGDAYYGAQKKLDEVKRVNR